jgi:hypothetical protein
MKNKKSKKRKLKDLLEKKSSLTGDNVYKKDLGTNGIKAVNNWDKPKSISEFKVTKKENKRRKQRQVRTENKNNMGHLYDNTTCV